MAQRRKITPEIVDAIVAMVAETGDEVSAYKSFGISKASYNTFKRRNEDFVNRLNISHTYFTESISERYFSERELAEKYLRECLEGLQFQDEEEYSVISNQRILKRVKRKRVLPPDWYLQKILGSQSEEIVIRIEKSFPEEASEQEVYDDFDD